MPDILHATLIFDRVIAAAVDKVFQAYTNIEARAAWGAPSDTATLIYDTADFREGGEDRFRCGSKDNPNIHGHTYYLDIVPNNRIVSTETIAVEGRRLCASLSTAEFSPDGAGTKMRVTTQLASFIGEGRVSGHRTGTNASLDNLAAYISGN